ncbi:PREDICTED: F-box protein SKIP27-like [Camelina sativa]|uniref:F-box protein SKIP27-like n=1 Tax=Camelina sativa TaxID=90675 RepID=A0ABM0V0N5_CAMSA|nr:PREDICTED: F-box protein SKIP27-like [Camelina sativa]
MIHYLHFIGEFWFSRAAKVVKWFSEKLLLSSRRRTTTMALTKRGFVVMKSNGEEEELELGLGSVRFTRGLGRKRILISSSVRQSLSRSAVEIPVVPDSPPVKSSLKRQRSSRTIASSEKSRLESLPQDLLIRVICGVDHDDLKSLKLVSKSIREASLVAKSLHFAYTTPRKTRAFRNSIDLEEVSDSSRQEDDIEPPNAPHHYRWTKAKRKEQLSSVSVALFT